MFSFQFKGLLGIVAMFGLFLLTLFLVFILPSMVATALWNALVYATLGGVKINLMQGGLLWVMTVLGLLLYFKPTLKFGIEDSDFEHLNTDDDATTSASKPDPTTHNTPRSEHWKKWRKASEKKKKAKSGH